MRTLIANTYAGSLLLGAQQIKGANIIGSYEDCGFGSWITKANSERWTEILANPPHDFFIDDIKDWPDQDLTDCLMLAHPPCAAFSNQNRSAAKRGTNTDAFRCTEKVLRYAMTNGAAGIAVESVMGALTGAWEIYERMAASGGYHVYRVLQNALLFGVPQFRERCWHVLIRQDLATKFGTDMTWTLAPRFIPIGATIEHLLPGTPIDEAKRLQRYINLLTTGPCVCGEVHGFDEAAIREAALSHIPGHKRSGFGQRLAPFFPEQDPGSLCRKHVSKFSSGQPSILAEGGWAPVLLGTSFWIYKGEPIPVEAYKAIMGFPVDYVMPEEHNYGVRTMLSKGVCPPVATWILDNMRQHLGLPRGSALTSREGYVKVCAPGRVVSFRPGKNTLLEKLEVMSKYGMPEDDELVELRDEEDMFVDEGETDGNEATL
jgi:site-specific DNA-cytosine methylase